MNGREFLDEIHRRSGVRPVLVRCGKHPVYRLGDRRFILDHGGREMADWFARRKLRELGLR